MTRVMALSACATLCLVMFAMPSNPQNEKSAAKPFRTSAAQKFAELSDQFMKDSLALSPTNASQAGYHKHLDSKTGKTIELDALLDDMSLKSMAEQRAFYEHWRERFRNETPVSALEAQDAADWQLIDDQIGLSLIRVRQDSKLPPQSTSAGRVDWKRAFPATHAKLCTARRSRQTRSLPGECDSASFDAGKAISRRFGPNFHHDRDPGK